MRRFSRAVLAVATAAVMAGGVAVAVSGSAAAASPTGTTGATRLYGAQTHLMWDAATPAAADAQLDRLAALGATTTRVDVAWASLQEGGRGQVSSWYAAKLDQAVAGAKARGIRPIVTLLDTPCWASSAPDAVKQGCTGAYWNRGTQYWAPTDPADFAWIAGWVAGRYGTDLAAVELWNEPNYDDGTLADLRAPDSAVAYAGMVEAAYPAVKAAAPGLPVLAGALSYSDTAYLDRLLAAGMRHFDGLSVHPYDEGRSPTVVNDPAWVKADTLRGLPALHDDLVAHGFGDRAVWVTELGWSTCALGSSSWCVTPDQQGSYLATVVQATRDWSWLAAIVTYTLQDGGTDPRDRESHFGLTLPDGTPKPAYAAVRDAFAAARSAVDPTPSSGSYSGSAPAPAPSAAAATGRQAPIDRLAPSHAHRHAVHRRALHRARHAVRHRHHRRAAHHRG